MTMQTSGPKQSGFLHSVAGQMTDLRARRRLKWPSRLALMMRSSAPNVGE
jgi:hypothetical protein